LMRTVTRAGGTDACVMAPGAAADDAARPVGSDHVPAVGTTDPVRLIPADLGRSRA
jgi:hypothetical protein